jgi:transcriptional regulator
MFQPPAFRVDDPELQQTLIRDHALGLLVTSIDGSPGPHGGLRFHLSRGNPLVDALNGQREALFVFQGAESYVSPDWYRSSGMVPTWNYAAVHAYGTPEPVDDNGLVDILTDLSAAQEGRLDKPPWTADKLDDKAYAQMRRGIVGFHMPIARIQGKWKMSQNRRLDDRKGVVSALSDMGTENAVNTADIMSELIATTRSGEDT